MPPIDKPKISELQPSGQLTVQMVGPTLPGTPTAVKWAWLDFHGVLGGLPLSDMSAYWMTKNDSAGALGFIFTNEDPAVVDFSLAMNNFQMRSGERNVTIFDGLPVFTPVIKACHASWRYLVFSDYDAFVGGSPKTEEAIVDVHIWRRAAVDKIAANAILFDNTA